MGLNGKPSTDIFYTIGPFVAAAIDVAVPPAGVRRSTILLGMSAGDAHAGPDGDPK